MNFKTLITFAFLIMAITSSHFEKRKGKKQKGAQNQGGGQNVQAQAQGEQTGQGGFQNIFSDGLTCNFARFRAATGANNLQRATAALSGAAAGEAKQGATDAVNAIKQIAAGLQGDPNVNQAAERENTLAGLTACGEGLEKLAAGGVNVAIAQRILANTQKAGEDVIANC